MKRILDFKKFEKSYYEGTPNLSYQYSNFQSNFKINIDDKSIGITALNTAWRCWDSNTDKGNVYEEVALSLEGDYLDIAFNSRYLLEGLKNIDCEEIYIEFTTNVNPCIIKPADGTKYTYLLLPVRISSNN